MPFLYVVPSHYKNRTKADIIYNITVRTDIALNLAQIISDIKHQHVIRAVKIKDKCTCSNLEIFFSVISG